MIRLEEIRDSSVDPHPADSAPETPSSFTEADRKIRQTIIYMLEHLNQPLQVAKLASLANISPSHFFALFKQQTGCAPIDFFIRLRMQHACQLLDGTSLNVKEVAAVLGYEDPFYFSRTFKSVNRVAPSEYRGMSSELKHAVKIAALPTVLFRPTETTGEMAGYGPGRTHGLARGAFEIKRMSPRPTVGFSMQKVV